jgi:hypothetical protein
VLVYDISRRAYGESLLESTPPPHTSFRSVEKKKPKFLGVHMVHRL